MRLRAVLPGLMLAIALSAVGQAVGAAPAVSDVAALQVVDCLLPGQVRRLGTRVTYLSARRPARLPARERFSSSFFSAAEGGTCGTGAMKLPRP